MDKTQTIATDELAADILAILNDQKAQETARVDLPPENAIASVMLVTSASSRRHAQGIARAVEDYCSKHRIKIYGREGFENANWILLDLNDIVLHIFQPDFRELYQLESLWKPQEEQ